MDTGLNTNVAIIIKDIYPKIARRLKLPPKTDGELLRYGRGMTWVMGGLIILMALYLFHADFYSAAMGHVYPQDTVVGCAFLDWLCAHLFGDGLF